jgi:hypothetical protein
VPKCSDDRETVKPVHHEFTRDPCLKVSVRLQAQLDFVEIVWWDFNLSVLLTLIVIVNELNSGLLNDRVSSS